MPKRIPIKTAKDVAAKHGLRQVILVAWDGETTHVVTYGVDDDECDQAAMGGNRVKDALGWPETLHAEPSRVKAMRDKITELEGRLAHGNGVSLMVNRELSARVATLEAENKRLAAQLEWHKGGGRDEGDEEVADDEVEDAEPTDGDLVTNDYVKFYEFGMAGNGPVVTVRNHDPETEPPDWIAPVQAYMTSQSFWPNIWYVGERGDNNLLDISTGEFAKPGPTF